MARKTAAERQEAVLLQWWRLQLRCVGHHCRIHCDKSEFNKQIVSVHEIRPDKLDDVAGEVTVTFTINDDSPRQSLTLWRRNGDELEPINMNEEN